MSRNVGPRKIADRACGWSASKAVPQRPLTCPRASRGSTSPAAIRPIALSKRPIPSRRPCRIRSRKPEREGGDSKEDPVAEAAPQGAPPLVADGVLAQVEQLQSGEVRGGHKGGHALVANLVVAEIEGADPGQVRRGGDC